MKKTILILVFLQFNFHPVIAQTDTISPKKIYRVWIKPFENGLAHQGVLFEVKDSSLVLSNSLKKVEYKQGLYEVLKVDAASIDVLQLRKNHKVRNGMLYAGIPMFLIGLASGISILTQNNENDNPNGSPGDVAVTAGNVIGAIAVTMTFTGIGMGIGALFGSIKTKYHIHGSQKQFDLYKDHLIKQSVRYNPASENRQEK
jgi:hypothetical protein